MCGACQWHILLGFALALLHTTLLMHLEINLSATLFELRRALVYDDRQLLFPFMTRSFWLHDHLHTGCRDCCKNATFCKLNSLFKGRPTHTFWSNCSEQISVWMVWFVAQATCNLQSFCWFGFLRQLAKDLCYPMKCLEYDEEDRDLDESFNTNTWKHQNFMQKGLARCEMRNCKQNASFCLRVSKKYPELYPITIEKNY